MEQCGKDVIVSYWVPLHWQFALVAAVSIGVGFYLGRLASRVSVPEHSPQVHQEYEQFNIVPPVVKYSRTIAVQFQVTYKRKYLHPRFHPLPDYSSGVFLE